MKIIFIFLSIFTIISYDYAQCGTIHSSCLVASPRCVGTGTGYTTYSSCSIKYFSSPGTIFVTGTFTFDAPVVGLSGYTFILDADAQIIINVSGSNKTVGFSSCTFKGCTDMWNKIDVKADNTLTFGGGVSYIEDSKFGIAPSNGGHASIRTTKFTNCWAGVYIHPGVSFTKTQVAVSQCTFTGSNGGLKGNHYAGIGNTSSFGIYVATQCASLVIGSNLFDGVQNGVYAWQCDMYALSNNNVFKNIRPVSATAGLIYYGNGVFLGAATTKPKLEMYGRYYSGSYVGVGVLAQTFTYNFENCKYGVHLEGSKGDIYYNKMYHCDFGVLINGTKKGQESWIFNNIISQPYQVGIDLRDNFAGFTTNVDFNTITLVPDALNDRVGVRVIGSIKSLQPIKIRKDTFTLSTPSAGTKNSTGVEISNVGSVQVYNQNRFLIPNTGYTYKGVWVHNFSDGSFVEDNDFIGNDFSGYNTTTKNKIGILIDDGKTTAVRCNILTGIARGINILNECESSAIEANQFKSGIDGLVYGDENGNAGLSSEQISAGNKWQLNPEITNKHARFFTDILFYFNESIYRVQDNDIPTNNEYWPDIIDSQISNWFIEDVTISSPAGGCTHNSLGNPGNNARLSTYETDIITDDLEEWPEDDYLKWTANWHVYNYLDENPSYLSGDEDAQDYLEAEATTARYKLWSIYKDLQELSETHDADITAIETAETHKASLAAQIETKTMIWSDSVAVANVATYFNAVQVKVDTFLDYDDDVNDLWSPGITIYNQQLDTIALRLRNISTSTDFDNNLKATTALLIKTLKNPAYQFDTTEVSLLQDIAALCHREGGCGVFLARNLLASYEISGVMVDDSICLVPIELRGSIAENNIIYNELNVFPNPGNESVSITVPAAPIIKGNIIIMNMLGETVKTVKLTNQHTIIDTSNLQQGMYLITLEHGNVKSTIHKWIKL